MNQRPFTLQNGPYMLRGVHHYPKVPRAPYIISAHGMLSTKDSPKYMALCQNLTKKGFGFVRFDFTGCGESEGTFADSTLTRRSSDLTYVIDWVLSLSTCNGLIGLFGSSLGGTVALIGCTLRDIQAVVLVATPVLPAVHPPAELQEIQTRFPGFLDDFKANLRNLPFERIHHVFIIHGDQDTVVSPKNALLIYEKVSTPKEIWMVNGADHQFLDETLRRSMLEMTVRWFDRFLSPQR